MSSDKIELVIDEKTTSKVERDGSFINEVPMDDAALKSLFDRGWQIIHSSKRAGRRVVLLKRPGK